MKAVITGGSSGLGFEIAKQLINRDITVLLVGRNKEKLEQSKLQLLEYNNTAVVEGFSFDIGDERSVTDFYKKLEARNEVIDYIFNVAGEMFFGELEAITYNKIIKNFNSNLIGLMLMTAHGIRYFKEYRAPKQRIISVLSTAALKGKKYESVYNASKWGARGFLESVREEVADTGIEVINIYPGGMQTPFWDGSSSGYKIDTFMRPEAVAKQIVDTVTNHHIYVSDITINRTRTP